MEKSVAILLAAGSGFFVLGYFLLIATGANFELTSLLFFSLLLLCLLLCTGLILARLHHLTASFEAQTARLAALEKKTAQEAALDE